MYHALRSWSQPKMAQRIRFTNTATPKSSTFFAFLREAASAHEVGSWSDYPKQLSILLAALERGKLAYAQKLPNEVEKLSNDVQNFLWLWHGTFSVNPIENEAVNRESMPLLLPPVILPDCENDADRTVTGVAERTVSVRISAHDMELPHYSLTLVLQMIIVVMFLQETQRWN